LNKICLNIAHKFIIVVFYRIITVAAVRNFKRHWCVRASDNWGSHVSHFPRAFVSIYSWRKVFSKYDLRLHHPVFRLVSGLKSRSPYKFRPQPSHTHTHTRTQTHTTPCPSWITTKYKPVSAYTPQQHYAACSPSSATQFSLVRWTSFQNPVNRFIKKKSTRVEFLRSMLLKIQVF
jgi:hypothetical protein